MVATTGKRAAAREPPATVGRYELLVPIGKGGMADVYLARATGAGGFEREVALKLVSSSWRTPTEEVTALLEEAQVAARIRHPNVVAVHDVGEDAEGVFLVMDYVEGDSVAGLVTKCGRLPMDVSLKILSDALEGLHAAHELRDKDGAPLGLVHRDFSPQNLLVGLDGVTRLADFGIAKSTRSTVTKTGLMKGKIGYVSPEHASGEAIDRRSDVWAAGVVAWELLTGERLYEGGEDVATLVRIVQETPPRARSVREDLPLALDQVLASALSKRDARIATAADLRQRLLTAFGEPLAETSEVAKHVRRIAGPMLEERRKQLAERAASAIDERPASARPPVEPPGRPTRSVRWRLAVLVACLSGGAFFFARRTQAPPTAVASPVIAATFAPSAPPPSSDPTTAADPTLKAPAVSASPAAPPAIAAKPAPARPATSPRARPRTPPAAPPRPTSTGLSLVPSPYEPPP